MYKVTIYTDGACSGNPGAAGIEVVLVCSGHKKVKGHAGNEFNELADRLARDAIKKGDCFLER